MPRAARLGLAAALALIAAEAAADVWLKQVRRVEPFTVMGREMPGREETVEIWSGPEGLRRDMGGAMSVIVPAGAGVAFILNHAERTYAEVALPAPGAPAPPSDMTAALGPIEVTVEATGETREIDGRRAEGHRLTVRMQMGESVTEIWAAEIPGVDPAAHWAAANAMLAGTGELGSMLEELSAIRGFPVLSVARSKMAEAEIAMTETLVEIDERPAPPGTYAPPEGWRKAPLFGR